LKYIAYILIAISAYILYSCASVKRPDGGPQDVEPPVLVYVLPDTNQTNFTSNKIELQFNELVELQNENDIIIQPVVKNFKTNFKGKKITLTFSDSLLPNTTYTIDFQKSIIDVTERNIAENIFVSFSTGNTISKGYLSGKVTDIFTDAVKENLVVGLFSTKDSIGKKSAIYFTKTSNTGEYKLRNIKDNNYLLIAFDDKNNNLIPNLDKETYGFIENTIAINNDSLKRNIKLIFPTPKFKINDVKKYNSITSIELSNGIKNYTFDGKIKYSSLAINNKRELNIYHFNTEEENINISLTDSLNNKIDTTIKIVAKNSARKAKKQPNKIITNYKSDSLLIIEFEKPIVNTEKISKIDTLQKRINVTVADTIKKDSIVYRTVRKIRIDTIYSELSTFFDKNILKIKTNNDSVGVLNIKPRNIMFYDSTAIDSTQLDLRSFTSIYYSSLDGIIKDTTNNTNYIMQFLMNNQIAYEYISRDKKFKIDSIKTGDYKLRIIVDTNKNGIFDFPDIHNNIPAENIYIYPDPIQIKKNWDIKDLIININTVDKPLKTTK
jgi:hypothetical protein